TELVAAERELVVRVVVHEVIVGAVAIEELDRALLHRRARPLRASLERSLHCLTALDVPEGDPDLGAAAAHLDVVVVEDLPELAVELDGDPLPQFAGTDHALADSWAFAPAGRSISRTRGPAGIEGTNEGPQLADGPGC